MLTLLTFAPLLVLVAVVAAVAGLLLRRTSAREPSTAVTSGEASWQAKRLSVGGVFNVGRWGVLAVSQGVVTFTPDGEDKPAWSVPARNLAVGPGSGVSLSRVTLTGAEDGPVTFDVSASEGARWRSAGDIRNLADSRVASEVQQVLLGWGARRG